MSCYICCLLDYACNIFNTSKKDQAMHSLLTETCLHVECVTTLFKSCYFSFLAILVVASHASRSISPSAPPRPPSNVSGYPAKSSSNVMASPPIVASRQVSLASISIGDSSLIAEAGRDPGWAIDTAVVLAWCLRHRALLKISQPFAGARPHLLALQTAYQTHSALRWLVPLSGIAY